VLAGSDQEGIQLQVTRIDLNDVAHGAARSAARLAQDAELKFTFQPNGPLPVDADAERCREVLLAVLDNAVKYTLAGGSVVLRTSSEAGFAVVTVSDTGIGVAAQEVERLFDRFYRVDKARSRAAGGTGLGLSIAREIVDAHHGTLDIESEPNTGTTVTLRLPLARHQ
jgi:signal transduction histidine kinase